VTISHGSQILSQFPSQLDSLQPTALSSSYFCSLICSRSDGSPENYILEQLSENEPLKYLDLSTKFDFDNEGDFEEEGSGDNLLDLGEESPTPNSSKEFEIRFGRTSGVSGLAEKRRREQRKRKIDATTSGNESEDSQNLVSRIRTVGCDKSFSSPIINVGNRHIVNLCDILLFLGAEKEIDRIYCEQFISKLPEVIWSSFCIVEEQELSFMYANRELFWISPSVAGRSNSSSMSTQPKGFLLKRRLWRIRSKLSYLRRHWNIFMSEF
jgi:hypothetical protein